MLSNLDVYHFSGSNSALCEAVIGSNIPENAPQHYCNYTARSIRAKAAAAIAAGKADEPFQTAKTPRRQDAKTAKTAKTESPSATETLPSELLAILPAMSMKLGVQAKEYILTHSSGADIEKDAKLSEDVVGFLGFFSLDTKSNREKLLAWAGVPTKRDFIAEKLSAVIAVLSAESNAKFSGMETENMQSLLETLTAFALTQSV